MRASAFGQATRLPKAVWLLYALTLCILCAIAYSGVVDLPLDPDDQAFVGDAREVLAGSLSPFDPDRQFAGRPLTDLVFMIGYLTWGEHSAAFHVLLVVLHVCAAFVTGWTLVRLGFPPLVGLLAGALFAVGVGHYHAVQWVACLPYPLVLMGGCAVLVTFSRSTQRGDVSPPWTSAGILVLAMLTHPAAIIFVPLSILLGVLDGRSLADVLRRAWLLIAAAVVPLVVLFLAYGSSTPAHAASHATDVPRVFSSWLSYLGGTYLTSHVLIYPELARGSLLASAVGVVMIGLTVLALRVGLAIPAIGLVWSVLAVLPFGGAGFDILEPRYFYLSSAGGAIVVAWLLVAAGSRQWPSWVQFVRAGLEVLIVLVSVAQLRSSTAIAHKRYARYLIADGQHEVAYTHYGRAHEIAPHLLTPSDYVRLTKVYLFAGDDPDPIVSEAWHARPDPNLVLQTLAAVSKLASASIDSHHVGERLLNDALERSPISEQLRVNAAGALRNLGVARYNDGDYLKAGEAFSYSAQLDPSRVDLLVWKARSLWKGGRAQEAAETVVAILDDAYDEEKGSVEAIMLLHEMIKEDQWDVGLWRLLALAYLENGDLALSARASVTAIALVAPDPYDLQFLSGVIDLLIEKEGPQWAGVDLFEAVERIDLADDQLAAIRSVVKDEVMLEMFDRRIAEREKKLTIEN